MRQVVLNVPATHRSPVAPEFQTAPAALPAPTAQTDSRAVLVPDVVGQSSQGALAHFQVGGQPHQQQWGRKGGWRGCPLLCSLAGGLNVT